MNSSLTHNTLAVDDPVNERSSRVLLILIIEISLIFFFVPAGRFDFRPWGLGFSTGYNAYKLFPLLALTWWVWRRRCWQKPWPSLPLMVPMVAFTFFSLVAAVASPDPYQAITETIELVAYTFFYVVLLDIPWTAKRLLIVGAGFCLGNVFMMGKAVIEYANFSSTTEIFRLTASYDYPNALVAYCILGIALLLWLYCKAKSRKHKIIIGLVIAGVLACAVASVSRATYLAISAFLLVLLIRGQLKLKVSGTVVLVLLMIGSVIYVPQILERFMSINEEIEQKQLASRFYIWPALFDQEVPDYSFSGVGLGPVIPDRMASRIVSEPNPYKMSAPWHPHSLYFDLFFSTGVMGLFMFLWLVGLVLKYLWQDSSPGSTFLIAGLVAFLAHQLIEVHLLLGNIPIALFAIMALASYQQSSEDSAPC